MKLYVLAIVLIALVACGAPSVSQDEHDTLRRDFRQSTVDMNELRTQLSDSQDEVDALKTEFRDLQNSLMKREQSTEKVQAPIRNEPLFALGQASGLVKERMRADLDFAGYTWGNDSQYVLIEGGIESPNICSPLIAFVMPYSSSDGYTVNQKHRFDIPLSDMYVEEQNLGNAVWLVELLGKNIKNIEYVFGQHPYTWKVYESTGTVERIGVDRDYC
tara:strand:- start:100 stop:750 length:651 start_codon:yes stop_codon:yes gene_type:complete